MGDVGGTAADVDAEGRRGEQQPHAEAGEGDEVPWCGRTPQRGTQHRHGVVVGLGDGRGPLVGCQTLRLAAQPEHLPLRAASVIAAHGAPDVLAHGDDLVDGEGDHRQHHHCGEQGEGGEVVDDHGLGHHQDDVGEAEGEITTMPNMVTIHGMVRHRPLRPMKPMRNSML